MFIACPDSGCGTALLRAKKLRCDSGSSLVGGATNEDPKMLDGTTIKQA
jgi:hypothetical protein